MTEVLCIVPPFNYGKLDSVGPKCPNLGIGIIAALIETMKYDVKILDCFGLELSEEDTLKEIKKHNPKFILIGAVTANFSISFMDDICISSFLNSDACLIPLIN